MRRRDLLSFSLLAVLLVVPAIGQELPAGVQKGASVEGITEYTYPNGLRVLLFPDATSPRIVVNVNVLVGSRHEGYGETGMAHLLEHLLFMETASGRDIKKELTARGAQWNGSTWYDRTNYYETVNATPENLRWALELEADRLVNALVAQERLDSEMTVVRNEFERGENEPRAVLQERVLSTAYLWHNYGKSTIGSRADIERVPIDRLQAFYKKYYQPDNVVLVVGGQIDPAHTLAEIAATFGKIPKPERKLDQTYTVEPPQDGERYVSLRRVGEGQALYMVYHIPAVGHPDAAPLEILASVMTGGRGGTGRLYKALVENKKALSASMTSAPLHDPGFLEVSANLSKEQSLPEVREIVLKTIEGVIAEPPSQEEMERARTTLLQGMESQMRNAQRFSLNLTEWISYGDWRLPFLLRDRIKDVKVEDVVRVAKTYLVASNRTVGEYIPDAAPVRAVVPDTPDLAAVFKDYKGGEGIQEGETINPDPLAVEARVERTKLAGGIKVVLLPVKTRGGRVSLSLDLRSGDAESLAGKGATASFASALLMRGSKQYTRQQIQDEADRMDARINVSGGGISIETKEENLIPAFRLAMEVLKEPIFPERDFEQIKQQRIAGLERSRHEPGTLASLALSRHLSPFPKGHPRYVQTIEEDIAELTAVTLDDVKKFHAEFYGASTGELVVGGQFNKEEVLKVAGELLNDWKSQKPYKRIATPYKKFDPINVAIETPDKENAVFYAAMRVQMTEEHPDYPALRLANYMFGGNLGSRMPDRIRNKEGLSYSVGSSFSVPAEGDGGMFSMSASAAPPKTPQVESSFLDELERTIEGGFTEEELVKSKKAYLDQLKGGRSSYTSLMGLLAAREEDGRTLQWDADMDKKLESLTLAQVNAAFRKYLVPSMLSITKGGDFKKAGVYQK